MKTLQGSQFRCFRNISFGIHEDDITSYNESGIEWPEDQSIKPEKEKGEANKAGKPAGD